MSSDNRFSNSMCIFAYRLPMPTSPCKNFILAGEPSPIDRLDGGPEGAWPDWPIGSASEYVNVVYH